MNHRRTAFNPNARGYHAVYHDGEVNHCPGCGRTHWLIGRLSAECAFCSTALPLKEAANQRSGGDAGVLERPTAELRGAQRRLIVTNFTFSYMRAGFIFARHAESSASCASGAGLAGVGGGPARPISLWSTARPRPGDGVDPPGGDAGLEAARHGSVRRRAARRCNFNDPDCAFDIRGEGAGHGPVTWAGVNLCDVKSVTLNRDGAAGAWVDYDQ